MRGNSAKLLLVAALVAGCTRARTELIIGLMTDLSARDMVDTVELLGERQGVPVLQQTWIISGVLDQPQELPGSFGIYSSDGSEPTVTLTATGYASSGTQKVVARTSITSLVHEQTLFMRLALVGACEPMSCPAGSSCIEGFCRPQAIDPHRFPVYRTGMEKTLQCNSGPKYRNTSTKILMAVTGECAANEDCIEGTCYKRVGAASDGGAQTTGPGDGGTSGTCDPVAQTGCAPGQRCYVSLGGAFMCKNAGSKPVGAACTAGVGDDCAAGLHCASDDTPAICRQYCRTDSDCSGAPHASGGTAEPTNVPRCFETLNSSTVKLCSVSCDPIGATAGCATGRACGFFDDPSGNEYTDCLTPGSVADGQTCTRVGDCGAGETCAATGGGTAHCRAICRPAQGNADCTGANQCSPVSGVNNPIFSACCPAAGC